MNSLHSKGFVESLKNLMIATKELIRDKSESVKSSYVSSAGAWQFNFTGITKSISQYLKFSNSFGKSCLQFLLPYLTICFLSLTTLLFGGVVNVLAVNDFDYFWVHPSSTSDSKLMVNAILTTYPSEIFATCCLKPNISNYYIVSFFV